MHKRIRKITGQKTCSLIGCIKSKTVILIIKIEKILERWNEYIRGHFHDKRGKPVIDKNIEGPEILTFEVKSELA